jgi:hypothetical protein
MTVWSGVFASLGAAARGLLTSGMDVSGALNEVSEDAGEITEKVLAVVAILGALAFAYSKATGQRPIPDMPDDDDNLKQSFVDKLKVGIVGAGEKVKK